MNTKHTLLLVGGTGRTGRRVLEQLLSCRAKTCITPICAEYIDDRQYICYTHHEADRHDHND